MITKASEARVTLEKMLKRRRRELASCERMIELLQPEWDKFQARTGHDVYVARDYANHTSAARTHRKEIAALEHALAATAPRAAMGEAEIEALVDELHSDGPQFDPLYSLKRETARLAIRATLSRVPVAAWPGEAAKKAMKGAITAIDDLIFALRFERVDDRHPTTISLAVKRADALREHMTAQGGCRMTGASEARVTPIKPTADDLLAVAKIADAIACRDFKRADRIAAAHREAATAPLIEALGEVERRLRSAREWAASLTDTDMNEIVADNGITAGMVVTQEAAEQVRRLDQTLTRLTAALAEHGREG